MPKSMRQYVIGIMIILLFAFELVLVDRALAVPAGPSITYVSNTTSISNVTNRSADIKGTITTLTMSANQQDYKWKAYVGNISGGLALDNANGKSIYDWSLTTITGEVFVTRASSVNWNVVGCVNQTVIDSEQSSLGMPSTAQDNINSTFNFTNHRSFLVGSVLNMTGCRSTATYINDAAQVMGPNAFFQEVLLKDNSTNSLIYSTLIENDHQGYTGIDNYDFQMIVAENESNTLPTQYFFFVELR